MSFLRLHECHNRKNQVAQKMLPVKKISVSMEDLSHQIDSWKIKSPIPGMKVKDFFHREYFWGIQKPGWEKKFFFSKNTPLFSKKSLGLQKKRPFPKKI